MDPFAPQHRAYPCVLISDPRGPDKWVCSKSSQTRVEAQAWWRSNGNTLPHKTLSEWQAWKEWAFGDSLWSE